MKLPSEILDIIASHGLDSCKTSIAWSYVSSYFRDLVKKTVGVMLVQDGGHSPLEDECVRPDILDFRVLLHKNRNMLYLNSDENATIRSIECFLQNFKNIVIVIQSDRSFSDPLASTLNEIARHCTSGTNVCIIYSTTTNFLSKLYFREFGIREDKLVLSELHIIGSSALSNNADLCDVDTLFETTYIYEIDNLFSLSVKHQHHSLIAPQLTTIKQLNYNDSMLNINAFLNDCTNLEMIDSMRFPLSPNNESAGQYILPSCKVLHLNNFNSGVKYPTINGNNVSLYLKISPAIRLSDPEFSNLIFENIKKLEIDTNPSICHHVRFMNCKFPKLKKISCNSSIISWDDLKQSQAPLTSLKINLNSFEQLQWLTNCPYDLKNLDITTLNKKILDFNNNTNLYQDMKIVAKNVKFQLDSIWKAFILQNVFLTNYNSIEQLTICLDEHELYESINDCPKNLKELGFTNDGDCILIDIPYITHLTLFETVAQKSLSQNYSTQAAATKSPNSTNNRKFSYGSDISNDYGFSSDLAPVISPSLFRWNNVIGVNNESIRKNSIISFDERYSYSKRRTSSMSTTSMFSRSSFPYINDEVILDDAIVFKFNDKMPDIFTTGLGALESALFNFEDLRDKQLANLHIIYQFSQPEGIYNEGDVTGILFESISRIINYPYHLKLPGILISNLHITFKVPTEFELFDSKALETVQSLLIQSKYNVKVVNELDFHGNKSHTELCFQRL